jgi:hypothetical protein
MTCTQHPRHAEVGKSVGNQTSTCEEANHPSGSLPPELSTSHPPSSQPPEWVGACRPKNEGSRLRAKVYDWLHGFLEGSRSDLQPKPDRSWVSAKGAWTFVFKFRPYHPQSCFSKWPFGPGTWGMGPNKCRSQPVCGTPRSEPDGQFGEAEIGEGRAGIK